MRAVWSFWNKPFRAYMGRIWREPRHHLLAWGLSLRLAREHYPETMLVTDAEGKALLVDRLGLEFAEVSTELDRLRTADPGWWALGKLVAYSMQDRPFVHLDTDVFLWRPLPAWLTAAPVFAQSPEDYPPLHESCGPGDVERTFAEHGLALPDEWEWARSLSSTTFREVNCGILGGARTDFLRHYASLAIDLVTNPKFAAAWAAFPEKAGYNALIEQFLLAACLDFHRLAPDSPFRGIGIRYLFPSHPRAFDPQAAAQVGYTHLLGDAKTHPDIAARLERRMTELDPAFARHCQRVAQSTYSGREG
jgi:hypothetical protein